MSYGMVTRSTYKSMNRAEDETELKEIASHGSQQRLQDTPVKAPTTPHMNLWSDERSESAPPSRPTRRSSGSMITGNHPPFHQTPYTPPGFEERPSPVQEYMPPRKSSDGVGPSGSYSYHPTLHAPPGFESTQRPIIGTGRWAGQGDYEDYAKRPDPEMFHQDNHHRRQEDYPRRQRNNQPNVKLTLPKFNGRSKWNTFLHQYEAVTSQWEDEHKLFHLLANLTASPAFSNEIRNRKKWREPESMPEDKAQSCWQIES